MLNNINTINTFKHIKLSTLIVLIFSVSAVFAGQKIEGDISNQDNGEIILFEFYGSQSLPVDTTQIKNGHFEFSYKKPLPRGFYRIGFSQNDAGVLIIANEDISLSAEKGKMSNLQIQKSRENDLFTEYQSIVSAVNKGVQNINSRVSKAKSELNTQPDKFEIELNKIRSDYDTLVQWQHSNYRKIADENEGSFVGKISDYFAREEGKGKEEYLGLEDLNDPELLRGDMFKTKYLIYYQQYLGSNFQILKSESMKMINNDLNPKAKEVVYAAIVESFAQADKNFAGKIAKSYLNEFPNSDIAQAYFSSLPQGPPEIGDEAPEIVLKNPDGDDLALSSLRGQIVLIDFWASWCGPCRRENPNVVRTYHEFKDQGFTVYSVSLDNNRDKWLGAIDKDGLAWDNHVSDLKGWQSAGAALYGVRGIPATFLIDQNGVIIAKNLRGSSLENKLKEVLGAN